MDSNNLLNEALAHTLLTDGINRLTGNDDNDAGIVEAYLVAAIGMVELRTCKADAAHYLETVASELRHRAAEERQKAN